MSKEGSSSSRVLVLHQGEDRKGQKGLAPESGYQGD